MARTPESPGKPSLQTRVTGSDDIALGQAKASSAGVRKAPWWLTPAIGLAVFACFAPLGFTLGLGAVTTLTTVLMYTVIAQGWNLLGGYGGYLNFGAAVFFGAGAYTAGYLNNEFGWNVWQTMIPAAVAALVVSVIVGYATLRLRSHYFAIFTLVLTFLAMVVVKNWPTLGGAVGLFVDVEGDFTSRSLAQYFYYLMFGLAVFATLIAYFVEHSNFGYALRAISEDEPAAQVLGVKTTSVKLQALLIGAAVGGLAGAVYAFLTGYIEPTGTFNLDLALDIVVVCVIGGLRSWLGPLFGSIIVVTLEQWLRVVVPNLDVFGFSIPAESNRLVLGILLLIFALFIRRGLVGLFSRRRGRVVSI
jgi:branched-chain amino acid transport system permease protein